MPRDAKTTIRADNRKLRRDLDKSKSMFKRTFRGIGRGIKGALRGALSPIGIGAGVTGLAIFGKQALDFEETLTRLQIQAGKGDAPEFLAKTRDEMLALAKATGIGRTEIVGGATALVNLLGHTETTAERLNVLAMASQASGASMNDLAQIAFKLDTAFDIKTGEDLEAALDRLAFAGKKTSIPLSEMGDLLARTAPLFKKTGATGVDAANELGIYLQVAQKVGTAKGPKELATQFAAFAGSLERNRKQIKKLGGFDVLQAGPGGVLTLRTMQDIFEDLGNSKLAKNPTLLIEALGAREAGDFATAILDGKLEIEALQKASRTAGGTLKKDFKTFMESPAGRAKKAFADAKESLIRIFTPERLEKFASLIEKAAKGVEFMADNAEIFIAAFAGARLIGISSQLTSVGLSLNEAAKGAGRLHVGLGKVAGGLGAFAAGFGIGTALDEMLGLSNKISDLLAQTKQGQTDVDRGLLQGQVQKLLDVKGGVATRGQQIAARGVLQEAERAGILGPGGEIKRGAGLEKFTLGRQRQEADPFTSTAGAQIQAGVDTKQIFDTVRAIQQAQAINPQQAIGQIRGDIKISVKVDQAGKVDGVTTTDDITAESRRNTQ